jgi:hypothetical protein
MADLFKNLENLAARARSEEPPAVDVSSRVVRRLRGEVPGSSWTMAVLATGAAAAAAEVLGVSFTSIELLTDPWSAFFLFVADILP